MAVFHVLKETPEGSSSFVPTGEVLDGDEATALRHCVEQGARGGRYAIWPYEAVAVVLPEGTVASQPIVNNTVAPQPDPAARAAQAAVPNGPTATA